MCVCGADGRRRLRCGADYEMSCGFLHCVFSGYLSGIWGDRKEEVMTIWVHVGTGLMKSVPFFLSTLHDR